MLEKELNELRPLDVGLYNDEGYKDPTYTNAAIEMDDDARIEKVIKLFNIILRVSNFRITVIDTHILLISNRTGKVYKFR